MEKLFAFKYMQFVDCFWYVFSDYDIKNGFILLINMYFDS